MKLRNLAILSGLFFSLNLITIPFVIGQTKQVDAVAFDGVLVAGYVNQGGFINFAGPSIKLKQQSSVFMLGMLPSLRFKEDKGNFKNSFVTPSLGLGITYLFNSFAIQVPFFTMENLPPVMENGFLVPVLGLISEK